jgi:hypothetical protein
LQASVSLAVPAAQKQADKAQFSRTTIDLGVVVGDVEKAVTFYTPALGFTKVGEFDVSGQMAGDTGLTDSQPFMDISDSHRFSSSKTKEPVCGCVAATGDRPSAPVGLVPQSARRSARRRRARVLRVASA